MIIYAQDKDNGIRFDKAGELVRQFFLKNDYSGKKILLLIPDNTRSGPVGQIFKMIFDCIGCKVKQLDILVALGTHQPMKEEQIYQRLEITPDEHKTKYSSVRIFNHKWNRPQTFRSIGKINSEEIKEISNGMFSEDVNVSVNKLIFDYDEVFIVGPVFPHEVVGFSGGHKYIFPGIAGSEIINFFHWLGAVITNIKINGHRWTPTRKVIERAATFIKVPRKLFAIVAVENELKGIFIGDVVEAWEKASQLCEQVHIIYKNKTFNTVLGIAPKMYEDLWTAGKVMYKLEPIVADGGKLIIYAPHLTEISHAHGKMIDKIGYHTRDYFLKQWDKFKKIPGMVLAHSTHVKGIGTYLDGVEKPRINVTLSTEISKERCEKVNLGFLEPREIDIEQYRKREDEGILVVDNAGEVLYKLSERSI